MFSVFCLGAALLFTALGLCGAGAALRQRSRSVAGLLPAGLMAVSTLAMALPLVLPGIEPEAAGSPLGWAAVMLGSALLALLDRRRRAESAMAAGSGVIMAMMWLAMAASVPRAPAAGPATHLHLGADAAPFAALLLGAAVLVAAGHAALALRTCLRQSRASGRIRLTTLHHPAMSVGMLLMGLGMAAPMLVG